MSRNRTKASNDAANGKKRHNIYLNHSSRARGVKLAGLERRSFSNLLEVLIDREYTRQFPAKTP